MTTAMVTVPRFIFRLQLAVLGVVLMVFSFLFILFSVVAMFFFSRFLMVLGLFRLLARGDLL